MASLGDTTMPATRRQRKSIGGNMTSSKFMDKENATVDFGSTLAANRKKSRSKSIGPGGLDVLKNGNGNRRASLAVLPKPPPRSILKPTIAPLAEIPPLKKRGSDSTKNSTLDQEGSSKIALRTEEEQQAAAKEREERDRRDARRKSLANRRVSFAAEATLHTFQIEYMPEPTTSRRRSSLNAPKEDDADIVPDSPEDETEETSAGRRSSALPPLAYQDDNTMASSIYSSDSEAADGVEEVETDENSASSSDNDSDADDGTMVTVEDHEVTSASVMSAFSARSEPNYGDNDTIDQALRTASETAGAQGRDFSDSDEEVIPSFGWIKKGKPQSTSQEEPTLLRQEDPTLLRLPDQTINDGMEMEMTAAVGGIIRPDIEAEAELEDEDEDEDQGMSMEITNALGGILHSAAQPQPDAQSDAGETMQMDMTMEFTTAVGGIQRPAGPPSEYDDENEDMSMEFTAAIGKLLPSQGRSAASRRQSAASQADEEDATMDMEMTVGVGKILQKQAVEDLPMDEETMGMDMTVGVGRILASADAEVEEGDSDETMGMDMTTAIGGIIRTSTEQESRLAARRLMEEEVNQPDTPSKSPARNTKTPSSALASAVKHLSVVPEQTPPSLGPFSGHGLRRSMPRQQPASPESSPLQRSPSPRRGALASKSAPPLKPMSPKKAPLRIRRTSPAKTTRESSPIRASSPVRTPQSARKLAAGRSMLPDSRPVTSPTKSPSKTLNVFQHDPETGAMTPLVTLTPQPRQHSGVGADKPGLGSPRVSEIFSRRASLGEAAQSFVPGSARGVKFADPRVIEDEVDRDWREENEKENGRSILEREADGRDEPESTLTLKEMIASMSPKRKPLKGRKSLHVGSASGLLGKRPFELDDEEDEDMEDTDGVKRLKGHQGSPVKNVKLQQPPSKAETTGRRQTRLAQPQLGDNMLDRVSPAIQSPAKTATSPKNHIRFRDVPDDTATNLIDFDRSPVKNEYALDNDGSDDRVHLQDFLNMTSIRFMELTTTKRRHTQAPDAFKDGLVDGEDTFSLQRCVVAGACTVPMLELYQHSCRELKKYISEGRRIVREIESETFEENPPLFREYMSATPEFKSILDNQFKNGKTHARLESKAMWYEWRTALQGGLKEGLVKITEDMAEDERVLQQQQKLLASVVPALDARFQALDEERSNLELVAQELEDCDPVELEHVRSDLVRAESDVEKKTREIAELRRQLEEAETGVEELVLRKQQCHDEIKEAEKVREDCRGWSTSEISSLQGRVDAIEKEHGWAITGISNSTVSMAYLRDIELVFDVASFQRGQKNSQIDLWYIAANRSTNARPATPEREFFVQCIRDHIRALPQSRTKIPDLLHMVRAGWDSALSTCDDIRRLNLTFPTSVARTSDSSVAVISSLLLAPLQTKVEVAIELEGVSSPSGIEFAVRPEAKVVYGEQFNVGKMTEFLTTHLGSTLHGKDEERQSWSEVLVNLHEKLLARGRK
ncbi:hypothetical protein F5X68DRAFT_168762 [Plectosphaerella plurivora]|uniref:Spc7 kinetochore protein domain-containing protein n=1 Tax=Plectosphaerella plurivora TaxID=936078 RepID=A0A9P9AAS5_9PEZI|nr:hypothetical protein F5X68DRAFT_168762 [Plectosphaerella plurivora]